MRIFLKTEDEIILLRAASQLATRALIEVGRHVVPTVALSHLRKMVVSAVAKTFSCESSPLSVVKSSHIELTFYVNGLPVASSLESACLLSQDDCLTVVCWACHKGYYSYAAHTFLLGGSRNAATLLQSYRQAMLQVVQKAVAGHSLKEMSHTLQTLTRHEQYLLHETFGHGVGRSKVEQPSLLLFSYGLNQDVLLKEGMCLVIAPVINSDPCLFNCSCESRVATFHNPFVPFGTTVVVRSGRPEILTSFETIQK